MRCSSVEWVLPFSFSPFHPHLTCRGGKDPAWFFQEELQGPLEATTHADEGGEGQVRPPLSDCKQTQRLLPTDPASLLGLPVLAFMCNWCREGLIIAEMCGAFIHPAQRLRFSNWRNPFKKCYRCILHEIYQLNISKTSLKAQLLLMTIIITNNMLCFCASNHFI